MSQSSFENCVGLPVVIKSPHQVQNCHKLRENGTQPKSGDDKRGDFRGAIRMACLADAVLLPHAYLIRFTNVAPEGSQGFWKCRCSEGRRLGPDETAYAGVHAR